MTLNTYTNYGDISIHLTPITIPKDYICSVQCDRCYRRWDLLADIKEEITGVGVLRNGGSVYERFKIEAHDAPPRRKQPRPFTPRISKVRLALWLLQEVWEGGLNIRRVEYRRVMLSRPCIYGVFSGRFGGFHPIRDKCVACLRCVQEYPDMCKVDRNPEFFKFADSYWTPEDPTKSSGSPVATISYEAGTGKIPIKGMGFKGGFAEKGWDSIWTDMSEIVRPTRDGVYGREYISTLVELGRKPKFIKSFDTEQKRVSKIVESPIPIIFDFLPSNLNSQSILRSIAFASRKVGTFFVASPEQIHDFSNDHLELLVPLISPSDLEENREIISTAPMVELTIHDSAAVKRIRELNPLTPISVRLPLTMTADSIAADLVKDGVDVLHLYANYHGNGWDTDHQIFAKDHIRSVHRKLVKESLRDEVTLIASGGITLAEHVPKAIICGADLVALDTTTLVALQNEFLCECSTPETGRIKPEKFNPDWGEQRLVNLLASWHDQLIEILSAMGMRDVRRLRGDVGRAMFKEDLEKEAFADIQHRT